MTDNLPPLPPFAPEFQPRWPNDPGGYTAEQMQAYARAAIEKDRERQSVPAGLQNIDRSVIEQALEWVEAQPEPRMLGAAKIITALREALAQPQPVQEPVAWLVTGPFEKRSFDMQSFAESWCKGLNKGFGEDVYKISNLVVQSSEPHEKCNDERMCAVCYSGQGKCKTQPVQEPVAWHYPVATAVRDSMTGHVQIEYIGHFPADELVRLYAAPQPHHIDLVNVAVAVRDACYRAWATSAENWRADVDVCQIVADTSPQAQPLSNEQITKLPVWRHFVGLMPEHHVEITRAIEQAHGITKGTT